MLGVHRSGTSMVSGILTRAGFQSPHTPLPPSDWNPEGYGESAVFTHLHDRLLQAAGTRWDAYTRVDPEWFATDAAGAFEAECRDLLQQEFDLAQPFVMKDPRMCRLLPFWLRVLSRQGLGASVVLVVRHPSEVASSLVARDALPRDVALLIWLRHVLEAEWSSRTVRRSVLRYDNVLADWRQAVARVETDLGLTSAEGWLPRVDDIDRFVKPALRHYRAENAIPGGPPMLADWLDRTWAALSRLSVGAEPASAESCRHLDTVREEFDRAVEAFGVGEERRRTRLEARVEHLEREGRSLASRLDEVCARRDALEADLSRLITDLEASRGHIHSLSAAAAGAHAQIAVLEAERAALRRSLSWRITAPLRALYRPLRNQT